MSDTAIKEPTEQEKSTPTNPANDAAPHRGTKRWIFLAAVIVAGIAAYFVWRYYSVRESTDDAEIDGYIHPISAREFGTVIRVSVKDNQFVKTGAVLVEFDPKDYQVALDKAKADLAEAQASVRASNTDVPITQRTTSSRLTGSEAGVEQSRASVNSATQQVDAARARLNLAQAGLRQAQVNFQKASRDVDRFKPLLAKQEIAQQQYDAAVATAAALQAQVDAAQAQIAAAGQDVRVAESMVGEQRAKLAQSQATAAAARTGPEEIAQTRARVQSAEARVQQAQANLEQAERNIEKTITRAPIDGIAENRVAEVGQVVQAGQPLLSIVPLEDIWVTANFKESQLQHMKLGQSVTISVDAYGGREYKGHVDSIAATTGSKASLLPPENATGNYVKVVQRVPVKIVLEKGQDDEHLLRPGMSVQPTVFIK
ncbi:MAG: HlyD family secretion protein [Bryobacteraceae bacterium]